MSVAVSRSDGVTVLTLTSDQSSACPPFCQLLGALCHSPALCSFRRLTFQRGGPQSALGALWIISGIMHIGLGTVLITNWGPDMCVLRSTGCAPVWLGVLFMFCGVCCVLAERYPRAIGVLLSGLLNLTAGVALSITGIVLYSIQISDIGLWEDCESPWYRHYPRRRYYNRYRTPPTTAPTTKPPDLDALLERCDEAKGLMRALTYSVLAVLIVLSALDLCLGLSSAILSFKSLKQGSSESGDKPLLKETKATTEKQK